MSDKRMYVVIGAKTKEFVEGMKNVDKKLKDVGKSVEKAGKGLTKYVTAPIVGATGALAALANKTGNYADKLLDLEQITGLSTDTLQEFEHVAKVAGVNFDGLTGTIQNFTRRLPQIVSEGGRAYEAIQELGVSVHDAEGNIRDMNSLFPELLNSLQSVENTTERNAIAQQIFGSSLQDLAPVLGMTADEMDEARKAAHELGLVQSNEGLQSANDFRIAVEELRERFSALWTNLAIDLIPILQDTLLPLIETSIIPAIENFAGWIRRLMERFSDLSPEQQENIIKLIALTAALGPALIIVGKLIGVLGTIIGLFKTLQIVTALQTVATWLFNAALWANPITWVVIAILALIAVGVLLWKNWDEVSAKLTAVWDKIKSGFKSMWDGMVNLYKGYLNTIISGLNVFIKAINKIGFDVPKWVPGIGGKKFGFNIPEIPKLHMGGTFDPGPGQYEGLAMLRKGEQVVTPTQQGMTGDRKITLEFVNPPGNFTKDQMVAVMREALKDSSIQRDIDSVNHRNVIMRTRPQGGMV